MVDAPLTAPNVRARLRRIWWRAGVACALLLAAPLALPRIQRALDPQAERRAMAQAAERTQREEAPVYVMPNGERRRAVAIARADPTPVYDSRDRALLWWCGILALVVIAGAVARTMSLYVSHEDDDA